MKFYRPVEVASYRERPGYQAGLLAGVCSTVAALILIGNVVTQDQIFAMQQEDQLTMLREVIPESVHNNNLLQDQIRLPLAKASSSKKTTELTVYVAKWNDQVTGFAFPVSGTGYGGPIDLIMGVSTEGSVLGVRVINHKETPGLGDKIELSKDNWITAFNGLSLQNTAKDQWAVKKDGGRFDQFTGATITPRAVVRAVYDGLQKVPALRAKEAELLKPGTEAKKVKKDNEGQSDMPLINSPETRIALSAPGTSTLFHTTFFHIAFFNTTFTLAEKFIND